MNKRTILIPVNIGEDYPSQLRKRLDEYGIKNREICELIGMEETQFSRLFRAGASSGKPISPRLDTVAQIEQAILTLRAQKKRAASRKKAAG
jgi:hypothetical protein